MKIRAITSFYDPLLVNDNGLIDLSKCSKEIANALSSRGYDMQSQRLATTPFPSWLRVQSNRKNQANIVQRLADSASDFGWQYTSIGPALPSQLDDFSPIPELLSISPSLFSAGIIANGVQVFPAACQVAADVIVKNAVLTADGFTNLRFAALANVPPYAPFLPAAYSKEGDSPSIALAMECADEVVTSFSNCRSLDEGREGLIRKLEENATQIEQVCTKICEMYHVTFRGFDFSPAPYPEDWCSLGKAIESLGVSSLGLSGSLAAAAIVASTLDQGKWKRCGFNGLMLPVLEDSTLASRADAGFLTIKDLLLYSAVCGTGLDTIPLAGDTTAEQLTGVLMDLGALACRLNKPLTGRLMPIPGKLAGDRTDYNFEFFANSRVMALDAEKIGAPMISAPAIEIAPRKSNNNH